jgi:predicted secreted hydrolase
MSGDKLISRRAVVGSAMALMVIRNAAHAQGFAGLAEDAEGFSSVVPGRKFTFPADHGPHPNFRIEWWYVTANLLDTSGAALGIQWTLFRHALQPGPQAEGWANQQIWMGHAAVTRAETHRYSEKFSRGGIGQAGAEPAPFQAWIDSWRMRGLDGMRAEQIAPIELNAAGADFDYALRLDADRALVLQGDAGYSRKSLREQASYYYSQPFFKASGRVSIDNKSVEVRGQAWMDREWSSQPLAPDQSGWDWLSLHMISGEKLMLYRLRQNEGLNYASGNWILADGTSRQIASADVTMMPKSFAEIANRKLPMVWHIAIPALGLNIECVPLNAKSWVGTSVAYWEGPISFAGSHKGVGYLEMTGY